MNSASMVTSDNQKSGPVVPGTNKYTMEGSGDKSINKQNGLKKRRSKYISDRVCHYSLTGLILFSTSTSIQPWSWTWTIRTQMWTKSGKEKLTMSSPSVDTGFFFLFARPPQFDVVLAHCDTGHHSPFCSSAG